MVAVTQVVILIRDKPVTPRATIRPDPATATRPPPFPAFLTTRALAALSPPGETVELLGGGPGLGFVAAMTDKQRLYLFASK